MAVNKGFLVVGAVLGAVGLTMLARPKTPTVKGRFLLVAEPGPHGDVYHIAFRGMLRAGHESLVFTPNPADFAVAIYVEALVDGVVQPNYSQFYLAPGGLPSGNSIEIDVMTTNSWTVPVGSVLGGQIEVVARAGGTQLGTVRAVSLIKG